MDQNMKREIILENYQNPKNKGLVKDDTYKLVDMNNDSCIDEVNIEAKVENGVIKDIKFDGEACAICTSAKSIMKQNLKGKTLVEAKKIIANYYNMIDEKDYDASLLDEAVVYNDIGKQPNRKKCALLSWWGIEKIVNEEENK